MTPLTALRLHRAARWLMACTFATLAAGCGGGGDGDAAAPPAGSGTPPAPAPAPAALLPSSTYANECSLEGQKNWIRSYLDEAYLFRSQVVDVPAASYGTPQSYFNALLVRTPEPTGLPRDRFSAVITAAQADTNSVTTEVAAVPLVKTLTSPGGRKVGYVQFNNFSRGAQDALVSAFTTLRAEAVQDLVLDMRFNSGGFLYIAQTAAALVAGPNVAGRVFEQLRYNERRAADTLANTFIFSTQVEVGEARFGRGTPLPQLNLPRVYILSSRLTCSASESVVNGLRGVDLQVELIGDTTCGKPYGFSRRDNCGLAYYPIEFQGANAKGFGDYTTGFAPTCRVSESPTASLGAADEPLLAAALARIDGGACPAQARARPAGPAPDTGFNGRLLLPRATPAP